MKKVMVLILILALAFTGCATVQTTACNPPANVIAVANAVIAFLLPELNILVPGSAAFNAYITAQNIAAGVCVGVTELNALIAWIQSEDAKTMVAQANLKAGPMRAKAINVQPLIDWAGTFK
jgi:hypothetical protein